MLQTWRRRPLENLCRLLGWPAFSFLLAMELLLIEHARHALGRASHLLLLLLLLLALHVDPVTLAGELGHLGLAVGDGRDADLLLRLRHAHHGILVPTGIGPTALHELHEELGLRVGRADVRARAAWASTRRASTRMTLLASCLLLAREEEFLKHLISAGSRRRRLGGKGWLALHQEFLQAGLGPNLVHATLETRVATAVHAGWGRTLMERRVR